MKRFDGRTVLLTGACGGFGQSIAHAMAAEGAKLVLSDYDPEPLKTLVAELQERHDCTVVAHAGDIADEQTSETLVGLAVEHFSTLDIAINNAGIAQSFVRFHLIPSEEARRVLEVDLLGVFFAMKHQLPVMERQHRKAKRKGAIVNISSVAGLGGAPRLAVYSAAKHGVVGLTRTAAAEYAAKGIRVNAICPSFARTDMVTEMLSMSPADQEKAEAELTRGVPMKRLAEVDEVVTAVLFAADPANSFMTGQAIGIDGGISAL